MTKDLKYMIEHYASDSDKWTLPPNVYCIWFNPKNAQFLECRSYEDWKSLVEGEGCAKTRHL